MPPKTSDEDKKNELREQIRRAIAELKELRDVNAQLKERLAKVCGKPKTVRIPQVAPEGHHSQP